ncbi:hypothetical protein [Cupriavidus plantarum]|uniref:hypothetical protein n=1 Tax=Cupriavidus plantarum TaxID=942865 RepID=UPI000E281919|nr:hypothetical protein [Cupriavidus plantarum]REE89215.1 hypothetical protein C7418_4702 [Cupriavidus plantarum]CAG2139119.1 hypothetical protein LMG26296_02826 [Cupriavidus plantarum]SMR85767.1 hypothetical protein SAMN05421735_4578 [Cupriavidus plantarum]
MRKLFLLAAMLLAAGSVHAATKCRNSKLILYTQEAVCPAGYTLVSGDVLGNVSIIGKSPEILVQESAARDRRRAEQEQKRFEESNVVTTETVTVWNRPASDGKSALCSGLADEATRLEAQMRQNSTDWLRERHREVRNQQYRNRC